jgi:hypothetical protein
LAIRDNEIERINFEVDQFNMKLLENIRSKKEAERKKQERHLILVK